MTTAGPVADEDPLTGAPLGDPWAAVRVGVAGAAALIVARVVASTLTRALGDPVLGLGWLEDLQLAFAWALPNGAALAVMAWRDRPGRTLGARAGEALLLATIVHVATASWGFFNLGAPGAPTSGGWLSSLTTAPLIRGLSILGDAVGLVLAARRRGRWSLGLAWEAPGSFAMAVVQAAALPASWLGRVVLHVALMSALVPLAERVALRAARAVRPPED